MKWKAFAPLLAVPVLLLSNCRQGIRHEQALLIEEEFNRSRQALPAAQTAEEWLTRYEADLKNPWNLKWEYLYAELPPQGQWQALIPAIPEKAREAKRNPHFHSTSDFEKLGSLFSALLTGDANLSEKLSRELIEKADYSDWQKEERVALILALSRDPAEGLQWLEEKKPDLLATEDDRTTYSSQSKKDPWDIALAEGDLQKGIALLFEQDKKTNSRRDRLSALNQLIRIGRVLDDERLMSRAADRVEQVLQAKEDEDEFGSLSFYQLAPWIRVQAEREKWAALAEFVASQKNEERYYRETDLDGLRLLITYHQEGAEAFLKQLQEALSEAKLTDYLSILSYHLTPELRVDKLAISHLRENGEEEQAKHLSLYLLASEAGKDIYYEQLKSLDPALFAEFLPKLLAYDPFEERPLIWQAELALEANELEKAKDLIDRAIALDPSDGDQGKESRMKCYHVLARILEKQGDQEQADFFFDVVKSIREGEAADDFLYAGLISEATTRYQAALGRFNDAYCLQSRLAMTLARNGKFEEAIPHFEKAFELMPVSFGPRESHCLGCEGIFNDERVQEIAERILAEFAKNNPDNPRAPYLLGMVMEEMNKPEGAIAAYETALKLDPDYYNCAQKLLGLLEKEPKHFQKASEVRQKLTAIAPYSQLGRVFAHRSDLSQAWQDAGEVGPCPLELPARPYPQEEKEPAQFSPDSVSYYSVWEAAHALNGWSREELLRGNNLLQTLGQFY
ncbi:tetratricopeptide repeat protein [Roseibacillus ishigakijimensis]|uniref:Tetratricopeptide repeat protein n=1 Tax=Roseibacillus ishigakijimensis TaxID=454146 RepID=A0A934RSR5_9BACT|nr:tetratricopeptide repeat protein [Roseibacillus ishigakijimensis]MBK1834971.1 tetratricopeptide repeat protein [Roseibacillus ishigakijimensis]